MMAPIDRADAIIKTIQQRLTGELENFLFDIERAITAALADQREADAAICDLEAEQRRARAEDAKQRGNLLVAEEYKLLADHSAMLAERIRGGGEKEAKK